MTGACMISIQRWCRSHGISECVAGVKESQQSVQKVTSIDANFDCNDKNS